MVELSPKQLHSIAGATHRFNIWDGSVRSGKTVASILAWLDHVNSGPKGILLMAGNTLDTIERNVIDPMHDLFPSKMADRVVKHTRGANTARILGRLVYVVGAHDAKAERRIRGLTLAGAYVDEATLVPEAWWRQLEARCSVPGSRILATTNPDSPNHWLKAEYLDHAANPDLDLVRFHFTLRDNPSLDAAYLRALEASYSGLWRKRYIEGLWVIAEGAVFEMWDPDRFVVSSLPPMQKWFLGIDYGTAASAFVAILIGLGIDNRVYVARELRWEPDQKKANLLKVPGGRQKTDGEYSADLAEFLSKPVEISHSGKLTPVPVELDRTFIDPSAASFHAQLRHDGFYKIRLIENADNDVLNGLRTCASALTADRVRVHESCVGLLNELPGYVWDPEKQKKGEDAPLKVDDHSIDAWRYAMQSTEYIWGRLPLREFA